MLEETDPKIVDRLNKLPPYENKEEELVTTTNGVIDAEAAKTTKEEEPSPEEQTKQRTTEQFEKLKESNNNLKKEVEVLKKKNVLESLVPQPTSPQPPQYPQSPITNVIPTPQQYQGLSQKQINETFKGLVDDAGYVDTGLLIETLNDLKEKNRLAEQRASQAEERTQNVVRKMDDFERNQIMRQVHEKYPTLNPDGNEFDENLWKFVRNEVVDQWMNGKPTDVMAAAEAGMRIIHPNDMKKEERLKLEQAETAKKNINALGTSQTSQRESNLDQDALIRGTQMGKKGALAERLRRSGY
jgi:hypothetical protein